jgi:hypothetical protein
MTNEGADQPVRYQKIEEHQRYQWRKRGRLSECLCCWFFLIIIIIIFISIFFILPTIG